MISIFSREYARQGKTSQLTQLHIRIILHIVAILCVFMCFIYFILNGKDLPISQDLIEFSIMLIPYFGLLSLLRYLTNIIYLNDKLIFLRNTVIVLTIISSGINFLFIQLEDISLFYMVSKLYLMTLIQLIVFTVYLFRKNLIQGLSKINMLILIVYSAFLIQIFVETKLIFLVFGAFLMVLSFFRLKKLMNDI